MLDTTAETNINRAPNQQHLPPSIWTEEKTAQFKDMHARNESYAVIAAALGPGFSRNAVAGRAYRLGLPKREPTARSVRIRRANDGGAMQQRITNKHLQKVKTLNGGVRVEESVVREELAPRADFLGITLLDLERSHCRFPKGEGAGILFCGQKVISGESWCVGCYPLVYLPPRPRAERGYHPIGGSKPTVF
jgi:hypothetical protein